MYMSSSIPPDPWFSTINFNESFFTSNTQSITLSYANATYLRRIGIATSVASLTTFNGDVGVNGTITTAGLINASTANFSGEVNFNSMVSPPHCAILPSLANDLCNKQYVDSQAPLTSYQLFLNYSETFTTPAPASVVYKKLNNLEILVPTPVPFTISTIGNQLIAGFFNSLVGLNIPTSIPAGLWTLLCYSNVNLIADQSHVGIFFTISGYDAIGVETILFTSTSSPLITVVSPLIGTSSVSLTVPLTSLVGYTGIGIKLYISSNVGATRTGTIFFQNQSSYSSILTSFRTQQAPDLLSLNNIWTGTNAFNNATSGALSTIADASFNGIKVGTGGGAITNINIGKSNLNGALSTGTNNTAIGNFCLTANTTGNNNTAIGNQTLQSNVSGIGNVSIGQTAGRDSTGSYNTNIGLQAGYTDTTGSQNTCIGNAAKCNTFSNSTAIGVGASATANNQIMLGGVGGLAADVVINSNLSVAGAVTGSTTLAITGNTTLGANITSTGTTAKFIANLDPAISVNTLKFQNSTVNGQSYLNVIPNGIAVQSGMRYYNTFDVLNAGALTISSTNTENVLNTTNLGTGVLVPLNIKMAGNIALSVSTVGAITASGATQINNTLSVTGILTSSSNILLTGLNPIYEANSTTTPLFLKSATTAGSAIILRAVGGDITIDSTGLAAFPVSPTAPTPIATDNSTKVATTAFIKTIAAPANFAGLGNSFFNSFLYSNTNPNLDYMIAGTLGGLAPVTNAAISTPTLTTFILMGIRLQAGINFNRYGWNQQTTAGATMRCALYTSQFVYIPNSVSIFSTLPANNGGRVEVNTTATVIIPTTDTYYIYMDGAAAAVANTVYGAFGLGVNVCNYLDQAVFTFTAGTATIPFKVATGVRVSGSAPTTNTDLKVGGLANMTYQQFLYGVFLSYTA